MSLSARPSARRAALARAAKSRATLSAAAAVLVAGTAAALVLAGSPGSVAATGDSDSHTVSVAGTGRVSGTPDIMRVDIGVQRYGKDVNAALNAANEDMRRIRAALARHGVKDADMQTSQLSISQHYGPIQPMPADGKALPPDAPVPAPAADMPASDMPAATGAGSANAGTAVAPAPMDKAELDKAQAAEAAKAEAGARNSKAAEKPMSNAAATNSTSPDSRAPNSGGGSAGAPGVAMSEPAVAENAPSEAVVDEPMPAPVPPGEDPAVLGRPEAISSRPYVGAPGWGGGYDGPNGYDVFQSLTVRLRDLDDAGATISDAAEAGGDATRINGVSFELEDAEELTEQARDAAFEDAKAKAQQYARLAGRSLGRVVSINEGGGAYPVSYPVAARDSAAYGSAVPIAAGSQEVAITASVVWELN